MRLKGERKLFDEAFTNCDYPDLLEENLEALGELLGLDAAELQILGLAQGGSICSIQRRHQDRSKFSSRCSASLAKAHSEVPSSSKDQSDHTGKSYCPLIQNPRELHNITIQNHLINPPSIFQPVEIAGYF